ncbi:DUF2283 domain-containing protein [Okibacterium endophyticum]
MRIDIDHEVDAAYLRIIDDGRKAARTYVCDPSEVNGMINIDFDVDGKVIGIEFINASQYLDVDGGA